MKYNIRLQYLVLLMIMATNAFANKIIIENELLRLDSCIQMKGRYDKQKEERLAALKVELGYVSDNYNRYRINYQLFSEYESYNYDSAYHYARAAEKQAFLLNNPNYQVEAGCAIVFCNLSAGLYKEAFEAMSQIRHNGVDDEYQKQYYLMWSRLYYDLANYNNKQPYEQEYIKKGNLYVDTLLKYIPEHTAYWYYAQAQRQMKSHDFAGSTETFKKMIALKKTDLHMQAIAYSCIGWNLWIEGREEEAILNLVKSAICDIKSSIKENTSTCGLANILYKKGDIRRAVRLAQSSLEDANFYGARHRKIQVGMILPIVEQDRYSLMERERNMFIIAVGIAILFILGLLVATVIIRRQVKKLREAQKTINERNQSLEKSNKSLIDAQKIISEHNKILQETNDRLEEANRIKTVYIGKSFYSNSEYIKKVEKLYQMVERKVAARQFDDLRRSLKESLIKAEREKMYEVFDETFLKLFPDFVEKFNSLFEEKDRKIPENANSLTNEMRIFALIRLGITNTNEIASFLDYSVHTVNTYKTRVKNKSFVGNEQFEQRIMSI